MIQNQCLTLSAEANAHAKALIAKIEGTGRMGFRFESQGPGTHTFAPIAELRVKDYVIQPVLGGVVIFVDPDSLEKGFGTDIALDGRNFVFTQSARVMPKVAEKTEEQKSEEKARRAASRASKGMKPGADKARVVRAAKEASLASDEAKAAKKKATADKAAAKESKKTEDGARVATPETKPKAAAKKVAPAKPAAKKSAAKKTK